jgi:hypothetical protein
MAIRERTGYGGYPGLTVSDGLLLTTKMIAKQCEENKDEGKPVCRGDIQISFPIDFSVYVFPSSFLIPYLFSHFIPKKKAPF